MSNQAQQPSDLLFRVELFARHRRKTYILLDTSPTMSAEDALEHAMWLQSELEDMEAKGELAFSAFRPGKLLVRVALCNASKGFPD